MALSNTTEDLVLAWLLTTAAVTRPTAWYLALYTSDPTDADVGTEVSGFGYARQAITFGSPSGGMAANTSTHLFEAAGGSWGTITHAGIRSASTGGTLYWHGALAVAKIIDDGEALYFDVNDIQVAAD